MIKIKKSYNSRKKNRWIIFHNSNNIVKFKKISHISHSNHNNNRKKINDKFFTRHSQHTSPQYKTKFLKFKKKSPSLVYIVALTNNKKKESTTNFSHSLQQQWFFKIQKFFICLVDRKKKEEESMKNFFLLAVELLKFRYNHSLNNRKNKKSIDHRFHTLQITLFKFKKTPFPPISLSVIIRANDKKKKKREREQIYNDSKANKYADRTVTCPPLDSLSMNSAWKRVDKRRANYRVPIGGKAIDACIVVHAN